MYLDITKIAFIKTKQYKKFPLGQAKECWFNLKKKHGISIEHQLISQLFNNFHQSNDYDTLRAWFWNKRSNFNATQASSIKVRSTPKTSTSSNNFVKQPEWRQNSGTLTRFRNNSTRREPPLSRFADWTRLCLARQTMLRFGRTVNSRNWRMVQIVCPYVCRRLGCHLPQPPSIVVDNISSAGSFVLAEELHGRRFASAFTCSIQRFFRAMHGNDGLGTSAAWSVQCCKIRDPRLFFKRKIYNKIWDFQVFELKNNV